MIQKIACMLHVSTPDVCLCEQTIRIKWSENLHSVLIKEILLNVLAYIEHV